MPPSTEQCHQACMIIMPSHSLAGAAMPGEWDQQFKLIMLSSCKVSLMGFSLDRHLWSLLL